MTVPLIMLLGRKDEPTDAVEEYCRYLGEALTPYGVQLEIRRVPWELDGWDASLSSLAVAAAEWRNTWVLMQYTALAWSPRGFPQRVLRVFDTLKNAGARIGVVFHDAEPNQGRRLIDRLRRLVQANTMRRLLVRADLAISTVPPERLSWLPSPPRHLSFIPVGANLPIPNEGIPRTQHQTPTIGVFSITGGESGVRETNLIIQAVRYVADKLGTVRLYVFGRHADIRQGALNEGFLGTPVTVSVEAILTPEQVVQRLSACDVFLFVRGTISSRRGSAIAGIAAGLPVIAFSGSETAAPITKAGVILLAPDQADRIGDHLVRVLSDSVLRAELSARSSRVYFEHFAWPAIAKCFAEALRPHT